MDSFESLDDVGADTTEVGQRPEHPDQVVALRADRRQRAGQLVEGGVDRPALAVQRDREPVESLQGLDDLATVPVELGAERPDLVQHRRRLTLAAVQGRG